MNPLDNLGDYNIVRDDLFKHGGDVTKLYNSIGDIAVAEKTPSLLIKGGVIGGSIMLAVGLGIQGAIKGVQFMKNRKKKLDEKPSLEQQLADHMENTQNQMEHSAKETDTI